MMLSISKRFSGFTDSGCQAFSELEYVCMYIFISGIKPIEQHTYTLKKHKKEKKEIILTTCNTHAMMFTTLETKHVTTGVLQ